MTRLEISDSEKLNWCLSILPKEKDPKYEYMQNHMLFRSDDFELFPPFKDGWINTYSDGDTYYGEIMIRLRYHDQEIFESVSQIPEIGACTDKKIQVYVDNIPIYVISDLYGVRISVSFGRDPHVNLTSTEQLEAEIEGAMKCAENLIDHLSISFYDERWVLDFEPVMKELDNPYDGKSWSEKYGFYS